MATISYTGARLALPQNARQLPTMTRRNMNTFKVPMWASLSVLFALCCAPDLGYAAGSAIVEIPTAKNSDASDPGQDLTMANEYKSAKNVVEEQKPVCWNWAYDDGYESEYNFRGTNLTPDADGAGFFQAEVSRWGFTLGVFGIHQFGTAHSPSFSIGEGGGGGATAFGTGFFPNPLFPRLGPRLVGIEGTVAPRTTQTRFNEFDVFFQYRRSIGWIDITAGNIGFFIDRRATTSATITDLAAIIPGFGVFPIPGTFIFGPFPSVQDEQFDRLYLTLSTTKIPYVQPQITYYQTVLSHGQDLKAFILDSETTDGLLPPGLKVRVYRGRERNDELGGYLEGRLKGNFPVTEWLSINPQGVISASFHDRTEPVAVPLHIKDAVRGRSLSDWNVAQAGIDLPIHVLHLIGFSNGPCAPPDFNLYFTPFGWYSYHISDPTPSTDRNEFWGGVKFTATF